MFCEECQAAVAIGTAANTRSWYRDAHSSTCMPPIDPPMTAKSWAMPEMIDEPRLRFHHVADGDDGEIEAVGLARLRIDRGGAGRAHAAAEDIRADDEKAVGIDGLARADEVVPPAGLAGDRVRVRDILVARQRMADQDGVRFVGVEFAIGLVGDRERRQILLAGELQGRAGSKCDDRARRRMHLGCRRRGRGF